MKTKSRLSLIVLLIIFSISFAYAQNASRLQKIKEWKKLDLKMSRTEAPPEKLQRRWQKLWEEIVFVSNEDVAEAKKLGAKVVIMIPNHIADSSLNEVGSPSTYSLSETSEYFSPELEYKNKSFILENKDGNYAFIADIGKVPIENINEQSREFIALNKYYSPTNPKDIKSEFVSDGIIFGKKVNVYVRHTYLIRNVMYPNGGEIFALKVNRQDKDGSIIVFIKKIKSFKMSQLADFPAQETSAKSIVFAEKLVEKVIQKLGNKGFFGINEKYLVLTGAIPKGKMSEALN